MINSRDSGNKVIDSGNYSISHNEGERLENTKQINIYFLKKSKIIVKNITSDNKINLGLSNMLDEGYGHFEVSDKGVTLVKKLK